MHKRVFTVIFILLLSSSLFSQKLNEYFIDTTDNAFDFSRFLNTRIGFMPVPMIITEPAVGYGAGLGLVYFHRTKEEKKTGKYGLLPPSLSVVMGAYTANGTWLTMLAHQGSYLRDRIRYLGALGYVSVNMDYYLKLFEKEFPMRFNMEGALIFQELLFRPVKREPFFLGLNYIYFSNDVSFDLSNIHPELNELEKNNTVGGLNMVFQWDSRDNIFTPNKGIMAAFEIGAYDEALGGQNNYNNALFRSSIYTGTIANKIVGGFRLIGHAKWGDVPFYQKPFVGMRGVKIMRYQGNYMTTVETEWRFRVYKRWSAIGFVGVGHVAPEIDDFRMDEGKVAGGFGFRYFIAKAYGMHAGIDIARGPENWAWYITMGSYWLR